MVLKKRILVSALWSLVAMPLAFNAGAVTYPTQEIRMVVPRAPGGGSDTISRLIAPGVSKILGTNILIENKPDVTTVRGATEVANSKPDGYTLFVADNSFYQNPAILPSIAYDTINDFSAVTMLAEAPVLLIANLKLPANNLKEVIELARKEPGKLTYSSGGIGSSTHLAGVLLDINQGIEMLHIPYKGSSEALNAVLGGQVDMQFAGPASAKGMVDAKKVKAIAIAGQERAPSMPEVPTLRESGVEDADVMSVWGIHAPAGTPLEIRQKLQQAIAQTLRDPTLKDRLDSLGYSVIANTPEEHQEQTTALVNRWVDISKKVDLGGGASSGNSK